MDWLQKLFEGIVAALSQVTKPDPTPDPGAVTPPTPPSVTAKASEAVKQLQTVLNSVLNLNPPLVVDGYLGPKTEAAIMAALKMAQPYMKMFGF